MGHALARPTAAPVPYPGMGYSWATAYARQAMPRLSPPRRAHRGSSRVGDTTAAPGQPSAVARFLVRSRSGSDRPQIVSLNARRRIRLRSFIAIVAAAGTLVILGHSALMHSDSHAAHPRHPLLASLGNEFAVNVDHSHLVDGFSSECHELLATPALLRSANDLVVLGAALAIVAFVGWLTRPLVAAGRGPPWAPVATLTNEDSLTQFCVARR